MRAEEFNDLAEKRFAKCRRLLVLKASEYANNKDRLHNFKDGAFLSKQTPEQYALSLVNKQFVALRDKITNKEEISYSFLNEKIMDIINYMVLIEALITEKK